MAASVGVLILTWNKRDEVMRLLDDLESFALLVDRVTVVDNASTDGTSAAIRARHPAVELIVNPRNLGGSGGFNTGLRAALATTAVDYVWLLDNDARVGPDSLSALLAACEADASIGLAGSLIRDLERPELVVEVGAVLQRGRIAPHAFYRNALVSDVQHALVDCDYVAICSALVRTAAVSQVGLLDERMFLNWDDMDWGLRFRLHGWRVVAVPASQASHASFTDRARGLATDAYYAQRNGLLTYAKHPETLRWPLACYRLLRQQLRRYCFRALSGDTLSARLFAAALFDFVRNRWGPCSDVAATRGRGDHFFAQATRWQRPPGERPLIIGAASEQQIMAAYAAVAGGERPWLLIPADRVARYRSLFGQRVITMDARKISDSLFYRLRLLVSLMRLGCDSVLCFEPTMFSFACQRAYVHNPASDDWLLSTRNRSRLPWLALAAAVGELLAILLWPILLLAGRRYSQPAKFVD